MHYSSLTWHELSLFQVSNVSKSVLTSWYKLYDCSIQISDSGYWEHLNIVDVLNLISLLYWVHCNIALLLFLGLRGYGLLEWCQDHITNRSSIISKVEKHIPSAQVDGGICAK